MTCPDEGEQPPRPAPPGDGRPDDAQAGAGRLVYRHRWPTRAWHWVNAACLLVLLMSGLMIFNAHPRLYWGRYGANFDTAWLAIGPTADGGGSVTVAGTAIRTTGVLGRWTDPTGAVQLRAFPWWATIPRHYSLAGARRWHVLFAWVLVAGGLAYVATSLLNRHVTRDLLPTRDELRPRNLWADIRNHARLRFHTGEAAARYNILQKLSYLVVIFGLIPLMVLTGMAMGPGFDAAFPWLLALLGGRQSARSLHFLTAGGLVLFVLVHLTMVVLAGPVNELRSIVTGWFRLPTPRRADPHG